MLALAIFLSTALPCLGMNLVRTEGIDAAMTGEDKELAYGTDKRTSGRRRRTTTTTSSNPTINIDFGGEAFGTDNQGEMVRPALVKSSHCTATKCSDCDKASECWHGVAALWGFWKIAGVYNPMVLSVAKNSAYTQYVMEVWAKCPSAGGKWAFNIAALTNGAVSFYADGSLVGSPFSSTQSIPSGGKEITLPISGNSKAHIRTSFSPTNSNQDASAEVRLDADGVDASVDDCMTVKDCASLLIDGSDAGFALRNKNVVQLGCLTGNTAAFPSDLKAKCIAWTTCMAPAKKTLLTTLLKAMVGTASLIADLAAANHTQKADPNTCINPETDDPESWECDCAVEMEQQCVATGQGVNEACFRQILCSRTSICSDWKADHCSDFLLEESKEDSASLVTAVAKRSTKTKVQTALGNHLDGTTQGKCAE